MKWKEMRVGTGEWGLGGGRSQRKERQSEHVTCQKSCLHCFPFGIGMRHGWTPLTPTPTPTSFTPILSFLKTLFLSSSPFSKKLRLFFLFSKKIFISNFALLCFLASLHPRLFLSAPADATLLNQRLSATLHIF